MDSQEKTFKNPIEEQRKAALEHYEQASRAANHWSSFVESAIKAYSPESCPPPVSGEVVSHNEWFNSQSDIRQLLLLHPDGEMIESSCLHFLGDDAQSWWAKRKASPSAPVVAEDIVTDEEINEAWGNANFGDVSKRKIILEALKKFAQGWATGHTIKCISSELGLIWQRNGHDGLSDKGLKYLLAASLNSPAERIEESDAVDFGEWILSEKIISRDTNWFDAGKHHTTKELYQAFKKQTNNHE